MSTDTEYSLPVRHELKIRISRAEYELLCGRFAAVMARDPYAREGGDYTIRSLYFDDAANSAYADKINGIRDRKKYRIRIYNNSDGVIRLECKEKFGKYVSKRSAPLSREECESLIDGDYAPLYHRTEDVCRELLALHCARGLSPKVVVDYEREAFVYPASKVRITFDKNLRAAGLESYDIFDPDLLSISTFSDGGVILEMKYDKVLPEFIARLLPKGIAAPTANSKYCICLERLNSMAFGR